LAAAIATAIAAPAAVIGANPPALPVTAERIAGLPAASQPAWRGCLARSDRARAADEIFYAEERKALALALAAPLVPPRGPSLPLKNADAWYASADALRIAANVVSFQTPAGGWNKNTDFAARPRRPGERSGYKAGYIGTINNGATITELRFLANVVTAAGPPAAAQAAFLSGLDYLFAARFPNGAGRRFIGSPEATTTRSPPTTMRWSTCSASCATLPAAHRRLRLFAPSRATAPPPVPRADSTVFSQPRWSPPAAPSSGAGSTTRLRSRPRAISRCPRSRAARAPG